MPHVAVLFEFPTLNGGERSMLAVLTRLHRRTDFQFSAIAPGEGDLAHQIRGLGIPLIAFSIRNSAGKKRDPRDLLEDLTGIIARAQPDILHSNSLSMLRLAGQLAPSAVRSCQRSGHLRDIMRLSQRAITDVNANDRLIAVSHATRKFHIEQGLRADQCTVIYNGVDTELFQSRNRSEMRSRYLPAVPATSTLLLNVGQICLRKGQLNLAKAVCRLIPNGHDLHLAIAGSRYSKKQESVEYEAAISNEFSSIGATDRLHLCGYRTDVNLLMNASDILVHSAHQEPFGRALLEAAASGLPIVATDVGGTSEMLRDGDEALLVASNDPRELSDAICSVQKDPQFAHRRAVLARQCIEETFTVAAAAENLAGFWLSHE